MKLVLCFLLINFSVYSSEISIVRQLYLEAYISEYNCNQFGEKLNEIEYNNDYLIEGYRACFFLIRCKFIKNPINKFASFSKGRGLLEAAIKNSPNSVELRFLRYSIQKNIPSFLFYNNHMEKDLNFVNENIKNISDKNIKYFITNSFELLAK